MRNTDLYDRLEVQKQEELPTILTPAEVMDILGIGKNTVYRLLNSGQLPAVRIGRMWKINLQSLINLFPIQ
ncbi:helix-turn-helix domain-containing protein [uncultured Flavonifractor sp.]|uniref:helix-turn-helix domain-containing protein n=1 Tax=uncultured Flavonifractor sp. TaxID=1193534 RepID=UPI0025990416|nr:helix-turn-helix domain-containing protein [uncultured Flavonifractor sp.]